MPDALYPSPHVVFCPFFFFLSFFNPRYLRVLFALRRRHTLRTKVTDLSRSGVFSDAFDKTLSLISEYCTIKILCFVMMIPAPAEGLTIQVKVVVNNTIVWDTTRDDNLDTPQAFEAGEPAGPRGVNDFVTLLSANLGAVLSDNTRPIRNFFGIGEECLDIVMRGNDGKNKALARVLAVATSDSDSELLEVFADSVLQQVSEYHSKWQGLASSFPARHVKSLLNTIGYRSKYLVPRTTDCVIFYVDVAGFTRLSEEVLVDPALILKFISTWANYCVGQVKRRGGVFDKLVGDCTIAIWGPPFFNTRPEKMISDAIECAIAIRNWTRDVLPLDPNFAQIRRSGIDLGVCSGINYCRLAVGFCGPDQGFTGFSSGMNETARLQGLATKHQILVMDNAAQLVASQGYEFSGVEEANVKNVARPLR
jgi:class 3 adenylate cyclase